MSSDKEHLQWLYNRFHYHYNESKSADFMLRFEKIIEALTQPKPDDVKDAVAWLEAVMEEIRQNRICHKPNSYRIEKTIKAALSSREVDVEYILARLENGLAVDDRQLMTDTAAVVRYLKTHTITKKED